MTAAPTDKVNKIPPSLAPRKTQSTEQGLYVAYWLPNIALINTLICWNQVLSTG